MLRRLGPRGDGGAGAAEYAGLIVVAALILGALWSIGVPEKISTHVPPALCRILGGDNCGTPQAGGQNGGQNGENGNGNQHGNPNGGDNNGDSGQSGDQPTLADLQKQAADAQAAVDKAERDGGNIKQQIIDLLKDFIGITDIEKCLGEGDIASCLWSIFDIGSWIFAALKIGKFVKAVKDAVALWKDFKRGRELLAGLRSGAKTAKERFRSFIRQESRRCATAVPNSFLPGRRVLLASGGTRPIEDVRVGDRVIATDPATGRTVAEPVTQRIVGHGVKRLVRLTVATDPYGLNSDTVTATANHPFWSARRHAWVPAGDLRPGDELRARGGGPVRIVGRHAYTRTRTVYNLAVADVHTYYVRLAGTAVLVHNEETCDAAYQGSLHLSEEIAKGNANHRIPGIDPDDVTGMEKYLDDWMKKKPDATGPDGVQYWYDEQRGYMILKKNEYSGTGRQMTPEEWSRFRDKKVNGG